MSPETATQIDQIDATSDAPSMQFADWLTKKDAARVLRSSEKQIERLVKKGEIQQRFRRAPGQARISIFHPGDVERVRAEAESAFRVSGNPENALAVQGRSDLASKTSDEVWSNLAATLAGLSEFAQKLNAEHAKAVYVSLDDAQRITGLSAATIRGLARAGRIARLSRKYRRVDLEGL